MQSQLTLPVTRRTVLKSGIVTAGLVGIGAAPNLQAPAHAALFRAVGQSPPHSGTVVERFGINIQPGFANEYQNYSEVTGLLRQLGAKRVRSSIRPNDPNKAMPYLQSLHQNLGITTHGTAGAFPRTSAERAAMPEQRAALARTIKQYAPMLNGLGGYNEPNGTRFGPRPSWWLQETLAHQRWLWELVRGQGADPALRHIKVCGPSLHDQVSTLQQDYKDCAVLRPYMERVNMHRYPAGMRPSHLIDERTAWAEAGVGDMPVVVTETGYNNGMSSNSYAPVSADVIGAYADRLLMEHVIRGNHMYWFEMLNNYPPSSTDSQNFWGLVSVPNPDPASWQPLPAFHTYRRLMALMADGTAPYSPSSLSVTVGGAADVKSFLVGKRDGSYLLALWRDVSLWDRKTRKPLTPSAATVNVTFAAPKMGTVYMPSIRDAAFSSSRGTSHSIQLRGNLAVLKITA